MCVQRLRLLQAAEVRCQCLMGTLSIIEVGQGDITAERLDAHRTGWSGVVGVDIAMLAVPTWFEYRPTAGPDRESPTESVPWGRTPDVVVADRVRAPRGLTDSSAAVRPATRTRAGGHLEAMVGFERASLRSPRKACDPDRDRPEWVERVGQRHPVVAVRDLGAFVEGDDEHGRQFFPGRQLRQVP